MGLLWITCKCWLWRIEVSASLALLILSTVQPSWFWLKFLRRQCALSNLAHDKRFDHIRRLQSCTRFWRDCMIVAIVDWGSTCKDRLASLVRIIECRLVLSALSLSRQQTNKQNKTKQTILVMTSLVPIRKSVTHNKKASWNEVRVITCCLKVWSADLIISKRTTI
jgi:hypothetical protein